MHVTYHNLELNSLSQELRVKTSSFINSATDSTPFHTIEWNEVLSNIFSSKIDEFRVIIAECDNNIVGFFPFMLRRQLGISAIYSPPSALETPYGGPITNGDPILYGTITNLENLAIKNYTIYTSPSHKNLGLVEKGYTKSSLKTTVLGIDKDEKDLWSNFNRNTKRNIKKAQKNGIRIVEGLDFWNIDLYYGALESTLNDSSVLPKKFYKKLVRSLYKSNILKVFSILFDDEFIGAAIVLLHRDTLYLWNTGIFRDHLDKSPNFLLVWEIIKWAASKEYRKFDFVRIEEDRLPGIAHFKLAWGGDILTYSLYHRKIGYFNLLKRYF